MCSLAAQSVIEPYRYLGGTGKLEFLSLGLNFCNFQARIFISRFKFLQFFLWFPKRINLFTVRKLAQKILFEVS